MRCGIGMVHQHFKLIDVLSGGRECGAWHEGTPESEKDIRKDPQTSVINMALM